MINRHNYEEFFLLYADDELNPQQRAEVELFVAQNPDMAVELEIIQQMKLQPEVDLTFPDKASLYKTADVEININNYEEFFFLYIDRELDGRTREKVEKFVLQHPQLQDEFTLLKQTILQPEAISFGDKSSLYRREERKIAYIPWFRVSAAAAVIAMGILAWWLYPGKQATTESPVAITNSTKKADTLNHAPVAPVVTPRNETALASVKQPSKKAGEPTKPVQQVNKVNNDVPVAPHQGNNNVAITNNNATQATGNNTIALRPGDTSVINANATGIAKNSNDIPQRVQTQPNPITAIINNPAVTENNDGANKQRDVVATVDGQDIVKPAVYKELDTDDEDRSMYVGSLQLNKDKVKGFLKRAGRIFGGKPKKDTD